MQQSSTPTPTPTSTTLPPHTTHNHTTNTTNITTASSNGSGGDTDSDTTGFIQYAVSELETLEDIALNADITYCDDIRFYQRFISSFIIPQIKHILRFERKKSTGRRSELVKRLLEYTTRQITDLLEGNTEEKARGKGNLIRITFQYKIAYQSRDTRCKSIEQNQNFRARNDPGFTQGSRLLGLMPEAHQWLLQQIKQKANPSKLLLKFCPLNPHYKTIEVVQPPFLYNAKDQMSHMATFTISPANSALLATSLRKAKADKSYAGPRYRLLLRVAPKNDAKKGMYNDQIPSSFNFRVNTTIFTSSQLKARSNKPIDISNCYVEFQSNLLSINCYSVYHYVFSIELCEHINVENIAKELGEKSHVDADTSWRQWCKILKPDEDEDLCMGPSTISLISVLTISRIQNPVRSSTCTHIQCFDLIPYLQMNETRPSWKCPVCHKPAPFETLFIDGYFEKILKESGPETKEVIVEAGEKGWKAVCPDTNRNRRSIGKAKSKSKDAKNSSSSGGGSNSNNNVNNNNNVYDANEVDTNGFVDLTLDDNDLSTMNYASSMDNAVPKIEQRANANDDDLDEANNRMLEWMALGLSNRPPTPEDVIILD